jgi:hypothetical protein
MQRCGSMTFWGGSGSADPCLFIDLQYASKKNNFLTHFFFFLLFEATFTSFYKDKVKEMVVLRFLHYNRRIQIQSRIRIHTSDRWIRIREAKHVDPDPQH